MFNRPKKPCGIFWDIENVAVPKSCSADVIAQNIRSSIVIPNNLVEREFFCVCNVHKLPKAVGNTLESIGVTIVQPFYTVKENAADTKILLLISKFIANWGLNGCAIVVVTGDSDFIDTLINLKLNYDLTVYLVHPKKSFSKELLWCADESFCLNGFLLAESTPTLVLRGSPNSGFIKISDLPQISTGQFIVKEIEKRCQKFCPGSRVLRVTKGAVWIGYADATDRPMNSKDLNHFNDFRVLGNLLTAELVDSLWSDSLHKVALNISRNEPNLEQIKQSVQISFGKKAFHGHGHGHSHSHGHGFGHQNKRFKAQAREPPKKLLYVKVTGFKDCKSGSPLIYCLNEFNSRFIRLYGQDVWLSFTEADEAKFAIDKICTYELDGYKLKAELEDRPPDDLLSNSTSFTDDGSNDNLSYYPSMTNVPSSSSHSSTSDQQSRSTIGARRILIQTTNDLIPRDNPALIDLTDTPPNLDKPNRIHNNHCADFIPLVDLTKDEA